ncbi:hypothetical protein, partial [Salmonella enterica]|uniref:hypothetical protein n=1 Tax=Salmonella enterica TaxID=28901 RepID=UPI001C720BCD
WEVALANNGGPSLIAGGLQMEMPMMRHLMLIRLTLEPLRTTTIVWQTPRHGDSRNQVRGDFLRNLNIISVPN